MLENLIFEKGEVEKILINDNIDVVKRCFASLYSGNNLDIEEYLINSLLSIKNQDEIYKIKILLSLNYLMHQNRKRAVELLNEIGILNANLVKGWLPEYFLSIWKMLVIYLQIPPIKYDAINVQDNLKFYIIGDSHLIGMAVSPARYFSKFNYIPGLRYSIISSPQNNIKIEGLKNAFLFSYPYQKIIISIGEIDTRLAFNKAKENSSLIDEILENFKIQFNDSLILINKLKLKTQFISLIIPPLPKDHESENINSIKAAVMIGEMLDYIEKGANNHGFSTIKYPDLIKKNQYFNIIDNYIDHAHFKPEVYFDIFLNMNKS